MGKKLTLAFSALMLGACAYMPAVGDDSGRKPHDGGKNHMEPQQHVPPMIGKDVEVRRIDADTLRKLGLSKEDALFAMSGDRAGKDKAILFLAEGMNVSPGELRPGYKLMQSVQIFALRNSPVCYWFQTAAGTRFYTPRPDCPH